MRVDGDPERSQRELRLLMPSLSTFTGAVGTEDDLPDPTFTTSPAGDLNHPAHHLLHAMENDAIVATQAVVVTLGNAAVLNPVLVSAAHTAAPGENVLALALTGNVPVTLPTAPADKSRLAVKAVGLTPGFTVSVLCGGSDVFNVTAGGNVATLTKLNQGIIVQYEAAGGIWVIQVDYVPLGQITGTANTWAGAQTFTAPVVGPIIDRGGQVFNVAGFTGADPTGATDSSTAVASARAAVLASGATRGIVHFGPGIWKFSTQTLDNNSTGNSSPKIHFSFAGPGATILTPLNANAPLFQGPTSSGQAALGVRFTGGFSCMPHPSSSTGPAILISQMSGCYFDEISFIRNPAATSASFFTGLDWTVGSSSSNCYMNTVGTLLVWEDSTGLIPFGYAASRCLGNGTIGWPTGCTIEKVVLQGIASQYAIDAQASYLFQVGTKGGMIEGCTFTVGGVAGTGGAIIPGDQTTVNQIYFQQTDGSPTFRPQAFVSGTNLPASNVILSNNFFGTAVDVVNLAVTGVNAWLLFGAPGNLTWPSDNGGQIQCVNGPVFAGQGPNNPGITLQNTSSGGGKWKFGVAATGSAFAAATLILQNQSSGSSPFLLDSGALNGQLHLAAGGTRVATGPLVLAVTAQTYASGTLTVNPLASGVQRVTLTANVATMVMSTPTYDGTQMELQFIQDATGSRTVAWPANTTWPSNGSAPVLSTAANAQDIFKFTYNGTTSKWVCTGRTI
jgi:hypothetical protein